MTNDRVYNREEITPTVEARANVSSGDYQEIHIDGLPPEVEKLRAKQFFDFYGQRLDNGSVNIAAKGMITTLVLVILDLQNGRDGFSGEPITGPAVGLDDSIYIAYARELPGMYRDAGNEQLAQELHAELVQIFGPEAHPDSLELEKRLDNIDEAISSIIDAGTRAAIDFASEAVEVTDDEIRLLEASSALTLTNAPLVMPLALTNSEGAEGIFHLSNLPRDRKKRTTEDSPFYFVMTVPEIPADFATFARDHVILKGVELLLRKEEDPEATLADIARSRPDLIEVSQRYTGYMLDHYKMLARDPDAEIEF